MATWAIHIELALDISTEEFHSGLKILASR